MKRFYESIVEDQFAHHEQAAFLCGPRQVGKTTIAKNLQSHHPHYVYWNWDNINDRSKLLAGPEALTKFLPVHAILAPKPLATFDEIHKYKDWKTLIKGIIDSYKDSVNILVTGSAKLDVFRKGGDSLMGRYFLYRIHPLSVVELLRPQIILDELSPLSLPQKISKDELEGLFEFGGFPEPFLKGEKSFFNRWQRLRQNQLFREDLKELGQIQKISLIETLAFFLKHQSTQLLNYTNLANKIRVSDQTIRRWIAILESVYYCFTLQPWHTNVTRSLLKEPKVYLWDWSILENKGQRVENFVASHLYKAVHFWTDIGLGSFNLYFLRDKDQREVDFLITKNDKPWIMVEVKTSLNEPLSPNLMHFQKQIGAEHVLQVAFDAPYVEVDCFTLQSPKIVPMSTFLSQLV